MDIPKAIIYVEQAIKDYEFEIENETTKLMKDTYSDVMEHYKTALIALKEKQERERVNKQKCPNCNGSGVVQEYDELDRYHVFECYQCNGTGEISKVKQLEGYSFEVGV